MTFVTLFFRVLLLVALPPVAFGLAVWCCQRAFAYLVGDRSGRPLLLATAVLSVPLRELGHAMMCLLFAHRIDALCLFDPAAPDGEFGYIEHSYRRKNPLAVLGNWFFALGPVLLGLAAVLVVMFLCFRTAFLSFFADVAALTDAGAGIGEFARATFGFVPAMFRGEGSVIAKIAGCALLALLAFGVSLSPRELWEALSGFLLFAAVAAMFTAVVCLFDGRVRRLVTTALGTYAAAVTALSLAALAFAVGWTAVGLVFFLVRSAFGLDRRTQIAERSETWKN